MGTVVLSDQPSATKEGAFPAWLGGLPVHTAVGFRHGQWYAIATDFGVAGMGTTQEVAFKDLSGLLESYLRSFYERGERLDRAVRPLSYLATLRLLLPLRHKKRLSLFPIVQH